MSTTNERAGLPARTHADAALLLRRPFAPGAIGFRAMMKAPLNGDPFGGAQVAAYVGAQSVLQRLNAVVPGRWRQEFKSIEPPPGSKRLYMLCRLIVTLPISEGGPDVESAYEDVGEMDGASRAGLKALYSDARKRAGVAAGIGAYLYTALEPVVLPIGPSDRQVQLIRRSGKPDMLALSPGTEQWLRHGYEQRMSTEAVRRDLGEILSHGEPDRGMGQGEAAEQPAEQSPGPGVLGRRARGRAAPRPANQATKRSPPRRSGKATASWSSTSAASAPTPPNHPSPKEISCQISWWSARPSPRRPRRPTWPPASRCRNDCPIATTASRSGTSRLRLTRSGSAARRRGAGATSKTKAAADRLDVPGSRVDDALSAYHRRILEHGDRFAVDQVLDIYREQWASELTAEQDKQGVDWEEELTERAAFDLGRQAIELAMAELIPHLGDPVDVQRRLEFTIADGLEWTVLCYLDLETLREQAGDQQPVVVDFKVKNGPITKDRADSDPQAGLYLAGRWLEGCPASELWFAQIAKPGKRRKQMAASLVATSRSTGQLRGVLARLALAASQIAACYERYGPDQPWGFADPTSWKCSARYCHAWASCPGGHGL